MLQKRWCYFVWLLMPCAWVSCQKATTDVADPATGKPAGQQAQSLITASTQEVDGSEVESSSDIPPPENSWPAWLGPEHTGVSTESNWNTHWPDSGLPIVWSKEIGIGFSSLAIKGGRLYSIGHRDGNETVYCLDTKSGMTVWEYSYPSKLIDNLYEGGPGSTPTVLGERVFTLGKEGQLHCFDAASGDVLWQRNVQSDFEVPLPEWGFNSSAVAFQSSIILEVGRVIALDQATGETIWQGTEHAAGYGSAACFRYQDRNLAATLDCEALRITDLSDGEEVAKFPWDSPFGTNSTTPIVSGDKIYISTGYQVGCGMFQFDGARLNLLYDNRNMRNHFNNSILLDGHLYGFDGNSNLGRVVHLTCMNFETGEVMWKQRGFGCGSLIVVNNKLLILADDGTLVLAEATPQAFREISRSSILDGRCWTTPVLLEGKVYARSAKGTLVAADVSLHEENE